VYRFYVITMPFYIKWTWASMHFCIFGGILEPIPQGYQGTTVLSKSTWLKDLDYICRIPSLSPYKLLQERHSSPLPRNNMGWSTDHGAILEFWQVVVGQACNPSYSVGRDWEDHHSRLVQTKSLQDAIWTYGWEQWHVPVIPATLGSTNSMTMSKIAWS
jgi:hypothetical protein